MNRSLVAAVLLLTATAANAQTPYAGMQTRSIKALSETQVADLGAGRGMGLALAAELNGYPGPSHVLELADRLELSADQRSRIKGLFDSMKAEAVPLGSKLIEQEADLDRQFASRTVTPESLKAVDRSGRRDARRTPRNTPQISSVDGRHSQPRADAALRRVARLWRQADAPSSCALG